MNEIFFTLVQRSCNTRRFLERGVMLRKGHYQHGNFVFL